MQNVDNLLHLLQQAGLLLRVHGAAQLMKQQELHIQHNMQQ